MNVLLNVIIYIVCILTGLVIAGILFMAFVTTIVYLFRKDEMTMQKNDDNWHRFFWRIQKFVYLCNRNNTWCYWWNRQKHLLTMKPTDSNFQKLTDEWNKHINKHLKKIYNKKRRAFLKKMFNKFEIWNHLN